MDSVMSYKPSLGVGLTQALETHGAAGLAEVRGLVNRRGMN